VLGPYLTKVAIDRYLAPAQGSSAGFWSWLSPRASTGIAQIAGIYVGLLVFSFFARVPANLLHAVDRTESDVRSSPPDFRHLQRLHVAFFDKNQSAGWSPASPLTSTP